MNVTDIVNELSLDLLAGERGLDREVLGGYCGDLLSDVMANAEKGSVWITIQRHQNIVAVALLKELAAIVLANGYQPDPETVEKAKEEGIPLLVSSLAAYELAGKLYEAGMKGEFS
ncbi:MAG: serine kinase [Deltaproteobacteria bacterium]|nr:serine kinase [Deltaproteobacteria bacterium]